MSKKKNAVTKWFWSNNGNKKYNVDEYAIKYLVGHSINDLTEKVYTDREIQ